MVWGSLSLAPTSLFPATSNLTTTPIFSSPTTFTRVRTFTPSSKRPRFPFKPRVSEIQLIGEAQTAETYLENSKISEFVRFKTDGGNNTSEMQTAIVTYKKKSSPSDVNPSLQVDLVTTIHVADQNLKYRYYEILGEELDSYDRVLYEFVIDRQSLEVLRNSSTIEIESLEALRNSSTIEIESLEALRNSSTSEIESLEALSNSSTTSSGIVSSIWDFSFEFFPWLLSKFLALKSQTDCLDYDWENWYHADLDYETFKLLELENGESLLTTAKHMAQKYMEDKERPAPIPEDLGKCVEAMEEPVPMLADPGKNMAKEHIEANKEPAPIPENLGLLRSKLLLASHVLPMPVSSLIIRSFCDDLGDELEPVELSPKESAELSPKESAELSPELEALSRLDFGAALKILVAKALIFGSGFRTPEFEKNSVQIGKRNEVVTEVLQRAISEGHTKIAVLYGGGHMADLSRRLTEEFDLVPTHVRWVTAWSIRTRESESQFQKSWAKLIGWLGKNGKALKAIAFTAFIVLDLWFWKFMVSIVLKLSFKVASAIVSFAKNALGWLVMIFL